MTPLKFVINLVPFNSWKSWNGTLFSVVKNHFYFLSCRNFYSLLKANIAFFIYLISRETAVDRTFIQSIRLPESYFQYKHAFPSGNFCKYLQCYKCLWRDHKKFTTNQKFSELWGKAPSLLRMRIAAVKGADDKQKS